MIAKRPSLPADVRTRLAALRNPGGARDEGAPRGTPQQLDAMSESMEILSDPEMAKRLRAGRRAVAAGDVVGLEELSGGSLPTPGQGRVVLTAPVARELAEIGEPSATELRQMLAALGASPATEGRALGMGLVDVWSARGPSHRVLYAFQEGQQLVTVLTVDDL